MDIDQPRIDLIWFGEQIPQWTWGCCWLGASTPQAMHRLWETQFKQSEADFLLFWDSTLGLPDAHLIKTLINRSVNVWHAGLQLGMSGLPGILDFAKPTWVFQRDPDADMEASSWRLSLKACLMSKAVLEELGFVNPHFASLDAAALELGYRYLQYGAILRHFPDLLKSDVSFEKPSITFADELLFVQLTQSRWVKYWTLARTIMSGYVQPMKALNAFRKINQVEANAYQPYSPNQISLKDIDLPDGEYQVTVLIPTLDRYSYLRQLLDQLRTQTIPPLEIIIVDQTEHDQRDMDISSDFNDLPLLIIYQDSPGQCSSRNVGLTLAKGDYVLFLDDDDEIAPDLIEKHLKNLYYFQADTSSGGINEIGALPLSGIFARTGISSVFPTNNTLIRKNVLERSGLFDMAYNHGQSADGDLGMRIYLRGALMIYNPQISVLHHRAPKGGLRKHKARVITYSSSRTRLLHRRFPHVTECYRMRRYFTSRQVREALWLLAAGTFSIRGGISRKLLKMLVALVLFPSTIFQLRKRMQIAGDMLQSHPKIPRLTID